MSECPTADLKQRKPKFQEILAHARGGCDICDLALRNFIAVAIHQAPRRELFAICDVIAAAMTREPQQEEN